MSNKQTVLVTGSSSGFGRLTVEALAKQGHTVFAAMRGIRAKNEAAALELTEQARRDGVKIHVIELDVGDDASVRAGVEKALSLEGRIDVAVNNAGVMASGHDEAFTDEQIRAVFDTNVFGVQRVTRAVLPHMRQRGSGLLVFVSSNMAQITFPFAGLYTATKRAVEGFAESYRYQLAPLGVDVAIVQPGGFPTDLFSKMQVPAETNRVKEYGPLADAPQKIFGGFAESLKSSNAPDPRDVANALVKLIETPAGQRPLRTVVDHHSGQGVTAINDAVSAVQKAVFTNFGLQDMLSVKPR